jgi:GDP-L-fucose synthase
LINQNSASHKPLDRSAPFYVAGHRGMVGSAFFRTLEHRGFHNVIGRTSDELDLRVRDAVFDFFEEHRPRYVLLAAAKVGGILANDTFPTEFLSDNLLIQTNVMDAANKLDVEKLLFLGSACIYPKFAESPIAESALMTGHLEGTNDAYAMAKIAGIQHVKAVRKQHFRQWISAMPTNLYGPGDTYSELGSHVIPALIMRYEKARLSGATEVKNWGTGTPRREFLFADDLADALLFLMENFDGDTHVNVGSGFDVSISEVAQMIAEEVGFSGEVTWDTSKPDGTPRRLLDNSLISSLGWEPRTSLREGIRMAIRDYRERFAEPI